MSPVDLSTNNIFKLHLGMAGINYQNMSTTDLRLPMDDEINSKLITYKKTADGFSIESSNIVKPTDVVARNNEVIGHGPNGDPVYNEWLIDSATARKNYGDEAIDSLKNQSGFTAHSKIALVRAVELTPELYSDLSGGAAGTVLPLSVSWSDEPMLADVGDYLTSGGYSIAKHNMGVYEPVSNWDNAKQDDLQDDLGSKPVKGMGMG